MRQYVWIVCVLSMVSLARFAEAQSSPPRQPPHLQPYTFGVLPLPTPARLEAIFAPFAAEFRQALGRQTHIRSGVDYATFATHLAQGLYDLAYVQPLDYAALPVDAGYVPLVRPAEPPTVALIATPGSTRQTLSALRGGTVALPPAATAVSDLALQLLDEAGLDPDRDVSVRHLPDEVACVRTVVAQRAHVCATTRPVLGILQAVEGGDYRLPAESRSFPPGLYVVHLRVPLAERVRLQQALLQSPELLALPGGASDHVRLLPASAAEYEGLGVYRPPRE